jgi:hypothetical protein
MTKFALNACFTASTIFAVFALDIGQRPSLANIQIKEATVVPFPAPGPVTQWPTPAPASSVPWASTVYYAPKESTYGKDSLRNIDAYLAEQCRRSGGRQYYCAGRPLNQQQIDWINSVGRTQLQQTHYRCGSDRWCTY